jgi:hypothetical protein
VPNTASAKPNSNLIKLLVGGLVLIGVLFKLTESEAVVKKKSSTRPDGTVTASKKKKDEFRPEDYTAEFASLTETTKNSFKPVIASKNANTQLTSLSPNGIPPLFAGGDPNWIYTGNMEVDGVPNALLENKSTGEGVFLRPKERWRKMVLREVGNDFIVLEGPNGYIKTVQLPSMEAFDMLSPAKVVVGTSPQTLPPAGPTPSGRFADSGGLTGVIGNTQANISDPNMDGSNDPSAQPRGRRSRRNQ